MEQKDIGGIQLKHCPFCGRAAHMVEVRTPSIGTRYRVGCANAACPVAPVISGSAATPEEAAAAWNRRAERTCRMVDNGCELCCSECDERHGYDDEPFYCKGCGAKVVE